MIVWIVEERVYNLDYNGYRQLQSTDPIYIASTKELAIKFVYDNRDDTENVFCADVYGTITSIGICGDEGPEVEVAIYDMSVDKLDGLEHQLEGDLWYDCRTVKEWCEEYLRNSGSMV